LGWFDNHVAKQGFASHGFVNLFGGPKNVVRSWKGLPQAGPQEQCLPHFRPYLLQAQDVHAFFFPLPFLQAHLVSEDFEDSSLVFLLKLGTDLVFGTGLGVIYERDIRFWTPSQSWRRTVYLADFSFVSCLTLRVLVAVFLIQFRECRTLVVPIQARLAGWLRAVL
jgi:hypothetical protein